ncbi:MAG TPA: hypothetical protein PLI59_23580, partial [Candidatus Obscuribacter sp.]|nr:hypothetical protein [Candidatus Obscuribacter sp.]
SLFVFAFCFAKNDAFFKIGRGVHDYASLLATIPAARCLQGAYRTERRKRPVNKLVEPASDRDDSSGSNRCCRRKPEMEVLVTLGVW